MSRTARGKGTAGAAWWHRVLAGPRLRSLVWVLIVLLALPPLMTLVYRLDGATPVSTLMAGRALTGKHVEREWVALDAMSPNILQAVIMSEDGQFCFHYGIDLAELKGVVENALEGERTRGASTIAMQTVKNLFLWPQRSFIRKAFELPYALFANLVWGKKRTLELYLNIAEFGEGIFGVGAASRHYFGRDAEALTRRQAALLATTLPNPSARNPAKPSPQHTRLASRVERLAARSGAYIGCLQ